MPRNPRVRTGKPKGYRRLIGPIRKGQRQYRTKPTSVEKEGDSVENHSGNEFDEPLSLIPPNSSENAETDNCTGFFLESPHSPKEWCVGFSPEESLSAVTSSRNHPMYGIHLDDEFTGNSRTVISLGSTFPKEHVMTVNPIMKRKARILSLFDGIGTAFLILSGNLKLDIDVYYSSEVCPHAKLVLDNKLFGAIRHVGDVTKLGDDELELMGRIDFLCGGPPCSQVALVNNASKKGLHDPTSESHLFYDFVRIRDYHIARAAKERYPFFWMMEMAARTELKDREAMSRALGRDPIRTNPVLLPVDRDRVFWTNLPQQEDCSRKCTVDIDRLLCPGRKSNHQRAKTLTTNSHNQIKGGTLPVRGQHGDEKFYIVELERLQGLPDDWTSVGNLSITDRRKLIGKAWCVPQVAAIMSVLPELFSTEEHFSDVL